MPALSGSGSGQLAKPNWTRVHLIYFALAAFDLLAIATGLWLSNYTKEKFEQSIASIEGVEFLTSQAADLHDLAGQLLGPANDIFAEHDPAKAQSDLNAFEAAFFEKVSEESLKSAIEQQIGRKIPEAADDSPEQMATYSDALGLDISLIEAFERAEAEIRTYARLVTATAGHAIAAYKNGNIELAAVHMQKSDAAGRRLQTAILQLGSLADKHLANVITQSKDSFSFATTVQYIIGGAIFAMVLMVIVYGHSVGKLLRRKYDEIEAAHESAASLAGELQLVNEDISKLNTDLFANMKKLTEAQDEMLRRGKMAQLGQLTATVAHELRNPLGAVRTSVFLLERKLRDKGLGVEPQIVRIGNGVQRCDDIISQLLDFARSRTLQLTTHDFDGWVEEILGEEAQKLPAAVSIGFEPGLEGRPVTFDPARMNRVIINLVSNASEAMVGKGDDPIKFTTKSPAITLTTHLTSRGVEIVVKDNGPGIAPENIARILEPLFTTKSFGTGLGLPAAEKVLQEHGGGIEVEAMPGDGARFTAWFPIRDAQVEAA